MAVAEAEDLAEGALLLPGELVAVIHREATLARTAEVTVVA